MDADAHTCGKRSRDDGDGTAKRARPESLCIRPAQVESVTDKNILEAISGLVDNTEFGNMTKFPVSMGFTRQEVIDGLRGLNLEPISVARIRAAILSAPPTHWRLSKVPEHNGDNGGTFVLVNVRSEQTEQRALEFCAQHDVGATTVDDAKPADDV
jgi:hypothetical protein